MEHTSHKILLLTLSTTC